MSNLNNAFMALVRATDPEKTWIPEPVFKGGLEIKVDGRTYFVKEGNWERINPLQIGIKDQERDWLLGEQYHAGPWLEPVNGVTAVEIGNKKFRFYINQDPDARVKRLRVLCSRDKQVTGFMLYDWEINKKNK